jgi:hypothetical protein
MLGAAKWLLEKEGRLLQNLLTDNPVCGKVVTVWACFFFLNCFFLSKPFGAYGTYHVQQGYTLVLTGHSLGGGVAALLAMLIHGSAHAPALGIFSTTLGIRPKRIMCWGYGCAPCVDQTIAQSTTYIHNIVLQVCPMSLKASLKHLYPSF